MLNRLLSDQSIIIERQKKNLFFKKFIFFILFLVSLFFLIKNAINYFLLSQKSIDVNDMAITHLINQNTLKHFIFISGILLFIIFILYLLFPNYKLNIKNRKIVFTIFILMIPISCIVNYKYNFYKVTNDDWNIYIDRIKNYNIFHGRRRRCMVFLEHIRSSNNKPLYASVEECSAFFQPNDYIYIINNVKNGELYYLSPKQYHYTGDKTIITFDDIDYSSFNGEINRNYYLKCILLYLLLCFLSFPLLFVKEKKKNDVAF